MDLDEKGISAFGRAALGFLERAEVLSTDLILITAEVWPLIGAKVTDHGYYERVDRAEAYQVLRGSQAELCSCVAWEISEHQNIPTLSEIHLEASHQPKERKRSDPDRGTGEPSAGAEIVSQGSTTPSLLKVPKDRCRVCGEPHHRGPLVIAPILGDPDVVDLYLHVMRIAFPDDSRPNAKEAAAWRIGQMNAIVAQLAIARHPILSQLVKPGHYEIEIEVGPDGSAHVN